MMDRVLLDKHPLLRQVAMPVAEGLNVKPMVEEMFALMTKWGGIGLAANQVGVLKRVITIKVGGFKAAVVNPEITYTSKASQTSKEGCLSFPGLSVTKIRAHHITLEGFDTDWKPVKYKLKKQVAVVAQHEIDHLDGIVIADG